MLRKIYTKCVALGDKVFLKRRKKKLNNTDFSIICNNCWGGYVYRRYGLPYLTPTVGLYFFAEDFVKLCSNVKSYMEKPLEFIECSQSRYKDLLEKRNHANVPIARLGDIEVIFLHYKTIEEAREKWERRAQRINYDNLIFKFSKMNLCTDDDLRAFDSMNCDKKICFLPPEEARNYKCGISFKSSAGEKEIKGETDEYSRYINLTKMINSKTVCGNKMEGSLNKI